MNEPLSSKTAARGPFSAPHIVRNYHSVVRDLCAVLQQHMDALTKSSIDEYFSHKGRIAYRLREERLRELRGEFGNLKLWTS
jgi:hypothetical protein